MKIEMTVPLMGEFTKLDVEYSPAEGGTLIHSITVAETGDSLMWSTSAIEVVRLQLDLEAKRALREDNLTSLMAE